MTGEVEADRDMNEEILQQAVRWHEAAGRGDCDWDAFTTWLEQHPAHQRAYDDVALLGDWVDRRRWQLVHLRDAAPGPGARAGRRSLWLGVAAAAVLVAVTVALTWRQLALAPAPAVSYQADTTATRRFTLDDGSTIVLAPGSSVNVSGRRQNRIELTGAAYFDVPHDPQRALVVVAGNYVIRDIGTRFEVVSGRDELKVAVTDGLVAVDLPRGSGTAQVGAGQRLLVTGEPPVAEYASIAADDVATWRQGRLVFRNEPLSMVAQQISRQAGVTVTVDPAIAHRRFSGVLTVGDGSELVSRLTEIMGLDGTRLGDDSIRLSAGDPGR